MQKVVGSSPIIRFLGVREPWVLLETHQRPTFCFHLEGSGPRLASRACRRHSRSPPMQTTAPGIAYLAHVRFLPAEATAGVSPRLRDWQVAAGARGGRRATAPARGGATRFTRPHTR